MGKHSIFENFKNLEIWWSKRDLLQSIIFDTFMLANWNFIDMFYTGNSIRK